MIGRAALACAVLAVTGLLAWGLPQISAAPTRLDVARDLIAAGRAGEAVHLLDDPAWRGVAEYRAGRYRRALGGFYEAQSVSGFYNLGTAYARLHEWRAAREAYLRVLDLDPGHADATHNLAVVARAEAAEQAALDAERQSRNLGQWRDGDRQSRDDDSGGVVDTGGEDPEGPAQDVRPTAATRGVPGMTQAPGTEGDGRVRRTGAAGPSSARADEGGPETGLAGASGAAMPAASADNAARLLERIVDDPRRVLAARLRAAARRRAAP